MKRRYWVMLAGAYSAAIIGYFVYQYIEEKRSEVSVVPYSHVIYTTTEATTSVSISTTATTSTTAKQTAVSTLGTTTATTSTAIPTTQTTTQTTTTTVTTVTTTTTTTTAATETTETTATSTTISFPLNLNTATAEQLAALPDIGDVLAQAIVDYRTAHGGFINRKELLSIPGIGEARYDEIRWLLYLDDEQPLSETAAPVGGSPAPAETAPLYINLNSADAALLLRLPGCDAATADAILWLRGEIGGFHNPAELLLLAEESPDINGHYIPDINRRYEQWKEFLFVDDNGGTQLP